jgi:hypothetical protein
VWQTEMVTILRHLINDLDATPKYNDGRLSELLIVSAQFVNTEVDFDQEYIIDVDNLLLTPDPTDRVANTRDDSFINLVCLKAACSMDQTEARIAAKQAVSIRDGKSAISLGGVLEGRLSLLKQGGWCEAYEKAKLEFQTNRAVVAGAAIISPFRVYGYDQTGEYR